MKKNIFILFATVLILIFIEFISVLLLKDDKLPFLLNVSRNQRNNFNINYMKVFGFDEINPFTGWKMSEKRIKSLGYNLENGFVVLEYNSNKNCEEIKLFITGGSTSDIALDNYNWPILLSKILKEKGICHKIYIGSVGGYHTGQEFLQLITFLNYVKPDIHISYSGANDFGKLFYVSDYESDLFVNLLGNSSIFLPNTIRLIKPKLKYTLSEKIQIKDLKFWKENMEKMQALANFYNYRFVSILQPVINYSGLNNNEPPVNLEDEFDYFLKNYNTFYPDAINFADSTNYIFNFTNVFSGFDENVFLDDCHLKPEYQNIIAERVFNLINDNEE